MPPFLPTCLLRPRPLLISRSKPLTPRAGPSARSHHNMGICYHFLSEPHSAAACFKNALALRPDYAESRMWLDKVTQTLAAAARAEAEAAAAAAAAVDAASAAEAATAAAAAAAEAAAGPGGVAAAAAAVAVEAAV